MSTDLAELLGKPTGDRPSQESPDFSLVLGGPLFQLLRRSHLSDDAMMLQRRRIIVISLIAWLPLLVLSALGGRVLGGMRPCRSSNFLNFVDVRYVKFLPVAHHLMPYLTSQAAIPEFQVRLKWRTNTVAMWDNLQVQHYAVADYGNAPRKMLRATLAGTALA